MPEYDIEGLSKLYPNIKFGTTDKYSVTIGPNTYICYSYYLSRSSDGQHHLFSRNEGGALPPQCLFDSNEALAEITNRCVHDMLSRVNATGSGPVFFWRKLPEARNYSDPGAPPKYAVRMRFASTVTGMG